MIHNWSLTWGMKFNISQSNVMSITRNKNPILFDYKINNQSLERVHTFCDLGLEVNDRLTWNNHINNCCKKANRKL